MHCLNRSNNVRISVGKQVGRINALIISTWWFEFHRAHLCFCRWTWYTRYYNAVQRNICACIYTHKVLLPLLLQLCTGVLAAAAVAVRRHVLDGKNCCWFIESDSIQSFLFSSLKRDTFWTYIYIYIPLGSAVAFTASVCLYYVLGSYRHVRSQGGHQWFAIFFASFAWSRVVSQPSTSPGGPDILGIILLQEVIYTWHATHTNRILLPLLLML